MENNYQKRGYLLEDFRLFHLNEGQKGEIAYHYHDFCKVLLLRSGTGAYSVEGQRYRLVPGDLVLLDSGVIHRPEFEPGMPYERTILYISPAFLQARSTADCDLRTLFSCPEGHVLRLPQEQQPRLITRLDELEQELSTEGYGRDILCTGRLLTLLVELGRIMLEQRLPLPSAMQSRNPHVQEILAYLDAHLTEELSIDVLAEQVFLSKYHMMRLFRQETGSSIHSYLQELRLLHARALMEQGLNATEACFRSGFGSYTSFTRAYGRRFGTTPTGRTDASARLDATYE